MFSFTRRNRLQSYIILLDTRGPPEVFFQISSCQKKMLEPTSIICFETAPPLEVNSSQLRENKSIAHLSKLPLRFNTLRAHTSLARNYRVVKWSVSHVLSGFHFAYAAVRHCVRRDPVY